MQCHFKILLSQNHTTNNIYSISSMARDDVQGTTTLSLCMSRLWDLLDSWPPESLLQIGQMVLSCANKKQTFKNQESVWTRRSGAYIISKISKFIALNIGSLTLNFSSDSRAFLVNQAVHECKWMLVKSPIKPFNQPAHFTHKYYSSVLNDLPAVPVRSQYFASHVKHIQSSPVQYDGDINFTRCNPSCTLRPSGTPYSNGPRYGPDHRRPRLTQPVHLLMHKINLDSHWWTKPTSRRTIGYLGLLLPSTRYTIQYIW